MNKTNKTVNFPFYLRHLSDDDFVQVTLKQSVLIKKTRIISSLYVCMVILNQNMGCVIVWDV